MVISSGEACSAESIAIWLGVLRFLPKSPEAQKKEKTIPVAVK
jgi:hypothetical protein